MFFIFFSFYHDSDLANAAINAAFAVFYAFEQHEMRTANDYVKTIVALTAYALAKGDAAECTEIRQVLAFDHDIALTCNLTLRHCTRRRTRRSTTTPHAQIPISHSSYFQHARQNRHFTSTSVARAPHHKKHNHTLRLDNVWLFRGSTCDCEALQYRTLTNHNQAQYNGVHTHKPTQI